MAPSFGVSGNRPDQSGDEIVVTGISGRLPESKTFEEFKKNLFDGVDMVTHADEKFFQIHKIPPRFGRLQDLQYFDAPFFGVHAKQAEVMEPQQRMLLEVAYEALVDAGVNVNEIRGTNTGVFIGAADIESADFMLQDPENLIGYELIGACKAFFANRISYAFDLKGPSCALDTACSSSLFAFQQAVDAIKGGQCDSAIVGGISFNKPVSFILLERLGLLARDGKCQAFEATGTGYVKSDAVVVVYLQKASAARRIYASVLGAKSNCDGFKEQGITFPSRQMQNQLIKDLFADIDVKPQDVYYVEAHAPGTPKGDPEEVNSIIEFYCNNRKDPLRLGSVKTNMGHAEAGSGLCALAKVIIAMNEGMIPQSLHYKSPNKGIAGLQDGRAQVVTTNEPWEGGLAAINCFGFGGINVHVLLKSCPKQKLQLSSHSVKSIPRAIGVSGRTLEAVDYLLSGIEKHKNDKEFLALVDKVHSKPIIGHPFRGFVVLGDNPIKEVLELSKDNRPIAFIFSGMGSQWIGMAKDLLKLEIFSSCIADCTNTLKPFGINLEDLLLNGGEEIFENILYAFVCIVSMQLALTDLLFAVNIKPDVIVGHSMGEIGCAYADGTITREQAILAAYSRGRAVLDTEIIPGAMAAVGLTWEEAKQRCPPDVFPACYNSEDNVTISGPEDSIEKFVNDLQIEGVFAKTVKSCGGAYHSKYIAEAGPKLFKALEKIIPNPKPRSSKWISSSIPESEWDSNIAQKSSAEYHVNNFLSPVLFHEALQHVPEDAIVIEVAPQGLLQAILKRTLKNKTSPVSLMKRRYNANAEFFLTALGKIYNAGAPVEFNNLYEQITFPVGKGTPMINSLIRWDHSITWKTEFPMSNSRSVDLASEVDLSKEADQYLGEHVIDGHVIYPPAGYLVMVWKTFAKLNNKVIEMLPVILEDIKFHRWTVLPNEGSVKFLVNIFEGSGTFEVCEGSCAVVTGKITIAENLNKDQQLPSNQEQSRNLKLNCSDIYKELHLRGFDYKSNFRSIVESDNKGINGQLRWSSNWITFIDAMMQFSLLEQSSRELYLPSRIQKLILDPEEQLKYPESDVIQVSNYSNIRMIKSGGVVLRGLETVQVPRIQYQHVTPKLEKYQFIPYENSQQFSTTKVLKIMLQTVIENSNGALKLNIVEVVSNDKSVSSLVSPAVKNILEKEPLLPAFEISVIADKSISSKALKSKEINYIVRDIAADPISQGIHLVIGNDLLNSQNVLENLIVTLQEGCFILLQESKATTDICTLKDVHFIGKQVTKSNIFILLRKSSRTTNNDTVIKINQTEYSWVEPLKEAMKLSEDDDRKIYLFAQDGEINGLLGMVNCLVKEAGGSNIRAILIQHKSAAKFSLNTYSDQMKKDLLHNVLKNGVWGCYRHLNYDEASSVIPIEHACAKNLVIGDLTSLRWVESPTKSYKDHPKLCQVYYSAINLRDVMLAVGKLPPEVISKDFSSHDCVLGSEFSGRDRNGKRIMGVVVSKALATTVVADTEFLWDVPEEWSLEEAATVPVAYMTSYYSLIQRAQLRPGETVLIHTGAGGVGQASISIATDMGCTVFTTVGSEDKREFIKERFPHLKDAHIGYSRDTSFEELVMIQTNGKGVDVILNTLTDQQLQASLRCLAPGGRFLELGKADITNNSPLGMSVFQQNVTFNGISLDVVFESSGPERKHLVELIKAGIQSGTVQPLPTTVFNEFKLEQAFRYLAGRKQIGKVVVKIRDEDAPVSIKTINALSCTYINSGKSYILVGGLGGFGLELANWLISRGATKIVLVSRSGVKTGYQSRCIRRWREKGICIHVSTIDASTLIGAGSLLKVANDLGPVGGIFNLAMVLHNDLMKNLSEETFKAVCQPKVDVSKCLDLVSRKYAPELDYFVNFSSLASGRGVPTQANYGLANSALERIAEVREAAGLPGSAIQWGLIGDVGLMYEWNINSEVAGTLPQSITSCLECLDKFLQNRNGIFVSMVVGQKYTETIKDDENNLTDLIANILGLKDASNITSNTALSDLGMDSLMGAEIKQLLECNYDLVFSAKEIRFLTFGKITEIQNEINGS